MDHPTLATAISGLIGIGIGATLGSILTGAKLRRTVAMRDQTVAAYEQCVRDLKRKLGLVEADNVRLIPHAEAHLKSVAQRDAALAKAKETNRARAAAKATGNVSPIKPKKRA